MELTDLKEARVEAIQLAGAILRDEGDKFWNGSEWHMNVTDVLGLSVLKLCFAAQDQGTTPEEDHKIQVPA